jgi:hypothetical protein
MAHRSGLSFRVARVVACLCLLFGVFSLSVSSASAQPLPPPVEAIQTHLQPSDAAVNALPGLQHAELVVIAVLSVLAVVVLFNVTEAHS